MFSASSLPHSLALFIYCFSMLTLLFSWIICQLCLINHVRSKVYIYLIEANCWLSYRVLRHNNCGSVWNVLGIIQKPSTVIHELHLHYTNTTRLVITVASGIHSFLKREVHCVIPNLVATTCESLSKGTKHGFTLWFRRELPHPILI